jgi:hypothetical protein
MLVNKKNLTTKLQPIQALSPLKPLNKLKAVYQASHLLHSHHLRRHEQLPPLAPIQNFREAVQEDDRHRPEKFNAHKKWKKATNLVLTSVVLEHNSKDEWFREVHGGIKMWVNRKTGEVSTAKENPNKRQQQCDYWNSGKYDPRTYKALTKTLSTRRLDLSRKAPSLHGFRSDSYDNKEVEELFGLLDMDQRLL